MSASKKELTLTVALTDQISKELKVIHGRSCAFVLCGAVLAEDNTGDDYFVAGNTSHAGIKSLLTQTLQTVDLQKVKEGFDGLD